MSFPVIAFLAPSGGELILILLALLLLFGPKDAPRILRSIQNALNKLQRAAADFRYKLMYGDLHLTQTEDSKDTTVYDAEEKSAEGTPASPPEHSKADESKHEEPV